jgi:hypothetical protein
LAGLAWRFEIEENAGLPIFGLPGHDQVQIGYDLKGIREFYGRPRKSSGSESPGKVLKLWQYFGRLMGAVRDTDEL